jgi:hypothetical protein
VGFFVSYGSLVVNSQIFLFGAAMDQEAIKKLTFSEYLKSKETLRGIVARDPKIVKEYVVNAYNKLGVKLNDQTVQILVKPNQKLIVEWLYDLSDEEPSITSIRIVGHKTYNEDVTFTSSWSGNRLKKWIMKHTNNGEII